MMLSKDDKQRLKSLISETLILLCKNGLSTEVKSEFCIDGVIGITLDTEELLLVAINQVVKSEVDNIKATGNTEKDGLSTEPDTSGDPKEDFSRPPSQNSGTKRPLFDVRPSPSSKLMVSDDSNKRRRTLDIAPIEPAASTSHRSPVDNDSFNSADQANPYSTPGPYYPTGFPLFPPFVSYTSPFLAEQARAAAAASASRSHSEDRVSVKTEKDNVIKEEESGSAQLHRPQATAHTPEYDAKTLAQMQSNALYKSLMRLPLPSQQQNMMLGGALFSAMSPSPSSSAETQQNEVAYKAKKPRRKDAIESSPSQAATEMWDSTTYNHVGQAVVRNEGCFVTSRIMTRKTGRKAKVVREILVALTVPPSHPEHIGTAREIGKNMLVFYKCPPDLIRPTALAKFGIELDLYQALFYSALKAPPSQSILPVVLRDSPYMCAHYDTLLQGLNVADETGAGGDTLSSTSLMRSVAPLQPPHLNSVKDESFDSFHNTSGSHKDAGSPALPDAMRRSGSVNSSHTSDTFETAAAEAYRTSSADLFSANYAYRYEPIAPAPPPPTLKQEHSLTAAPSAEQQQQQAFHEADTSANISSDMENIDILNDSDPQTKQDVVGSTVNDSSLQDDSAQGTPGYQTAAPATASFQSPLLGLQRMLTSQNPMT